MAVLLFKEFVIQVYYPVNDYFIYFVYCLFEEIKHFFLFEFLCKFTKTLRANKYRYI